MKHNQPPLGQFGDNEPFSDDEKDVAAALGRLRTDRKATNQDDSTQDPEPLSEAQWVPSAEFAESLKSRLDGLFVAEFPEVSGDEPATISFLRRSHWKKLSLGFVAAAAAVLMMVVYPSPKSYGFESMRKRIAEKAFVKAQFEATEGQMVGWSSREGKFAAVESSVSVLLQDDSSIPVLFDRHSGALERLDSPQHANEPMASSQQQAIHVLKVMAAIRGSADSTLKVISESWREISPVAGADIELSVSMADDTIERLDVSFGIDSATELPVWMNLSTPEPTSAVAKVSLGYPVGGPTELASLGVPSSAIASLNLSASSARQTPPDAVASAGGALGPLSPMPDAAAPGKSSVAVAEPSRQEKESLAADETDKSGFTVEASGRTWPEPVAVDVPENAAAMATRIDERITEVWNRYGALGSKRAGPYTLVRRSYLDLTGRVPRASEIRTAVRDNTVDFEKLVNFLVDSPDFDTHMAAVWTRWLLPQDVDLDQFGGKATFSDWLADQFAQNVSYDEIVRKLLLAEGRVGTPGPVLFTTALQMKADHLAKQTARTFLGTRIDCAMCHDHPYDDWTQADFWGYAALFARISRPDSKLEMMSPVLQVKDVGFGEVTYPDTDIVVAPKLLGAHELVEDPGSIRRRAELASWLTNVENRQFARATVNLVWSHFFGAGLVNPRDDFGSHNPPLSEPLMEELAQFFIDSNYDVRQLARSMVLSSVYQQTSASGRRVDRTDASMVDDKTDPLIAPESAAVSADAPADRPLFDKMPVRWLSAEAIYDGIVVASGGLSDGSTVNASGALQRIGVASRDQFVSQFGGNNESSLRFQAGIPQALMMMNGAIASSASSEHRSRLIRGLEAPFFTDASRINTVFLAIVSRPPSDAERETLLGMLAGQDAIERKKVLSDLVWALFNSAEFATNH